MSRARDCSKTRERLSELRVREIHYDNQPFKPEGPNRKKATDSTTASNRSLPQTAVPSPLPEFR